MFSGDLWGVSLFFFLPNLGCAVGWDGSRVRRSCRFALRCYWCGFAVCAAGVGVAGGIDRAALVAHGFGVELYALGGQFHDEGQWHQYEDREGQDGERILIAEH